MVKNLISAFLFLFAVSCNQSSKDISFASTPTSDLVNTEIYKNIFNSIAHINEQIIQDTDELNTPEEEWGPDEGNVFSVSKDEDELKNNIAILSKEVEILNNFLYRVEIGLHNSSSLKNYETVEGNKEYTCSISDLEHLLVYVYNLDRSFLGSFEELLSAERFKKQSILWKIRTFMKEDCN